MDDTPRPHMAALPTFPAAQQAQTSTLNENLSDALGLITDMRSPR